MYDVENQHSLLENPVNDNVWKPWNHQLACVLNPPVAATKRTLRKLWTAS
jgi:hypothetical protein